MTAALVLCAAVGVASQAPATVSAADAPDLVGVVPSAATPYVLDSGSGTSAVLAVAAVGSKVVLGGTFSKVSDSGGPTLAAHNLAIYDSRTGLITSLPTVNGTVTTLAPGPKAGTVLVGGRFTKVNSTAVSNLALVNVGTGNVSTSFHGPAFNDDVTDLALVGSHLLVGGKFTKVDGKTRTALVSLASTTGKPDGLVAISFAGHHNWRGTNPTDAKAAVGITRMATNPAGTQLVVVGNFTTVGGLARNQIAVIDLTSTTARVSTTWYTTSLSSACNRQKWDSWVRDVAVSPDGSYLVVANTGGPQRRHRVRRCSPVRPDHPRARRRAYLGDLDRWDTLLSVAIGAKVVYVGGHQRWLNNYHGINAAKDGAVPRASLAALDPLTGVPYSWNPGRNPRGVGVSALLLTPTGLFVGSDTDYMGNSTYLRPRIAFLPLSTGTTLPSTAVPAAPDVYRAGAVDLGAGDLQRLHVGAAGADYTWPTTVASTVDWSQVRGAFTVGDQLWTATADGSLVSQSFDGSTVGGPVVAQPWADPVWKDEQTGSSGTQTYLGQASHRSRPSWRTSGRSPTPAVGCSTP